MKTTVLNHIRNKGLFICMLFMFLFAMESYAQYGTSRRVARRTARRTTRRNVGYYGGGVGYYGGAAVVTGAAYVSSLPAGCILRAVAGIDYQYCNGIYYRPFYQGTDVVYEEVEL
jgi:hypothetical protein